jgi:hypothetical protein
MIVVKVWFGRLSAIYFVFDSFRAAWKRFLQTRNICTCQYSIYARYFCYINFLRMRFVKYEMIQLFFKEIQYLQSITNTARLTQLCTCYYLHNTYNYKSAFQCRTFSFPKISSQSSLYDDSHYETSPIGTFLIKRIPSTWLVIRAWIRSSEIFRKQNPTHDNENANKGRNVAQWNQGKYLNHFALRSALVCILWKSLLFFTML